MKSKMGIDVEIRKAVDLNIGEKGASLKRKGKEAGGGGGGGEGEGEGGEGCKTASSRLDDTMKPSSVSTAMSIAL